ncbi:putative TRAP transporter small permease protein [Vibrio halioticoli NBRC 102217]|uniref:TRAP transporter small permease protein n=1 Tax=Vibrio halioticoli NBRC 102217 TaxID=1219072 RepID=V5FI70_9VIBR|nr:TRAP transporter small permease [Vibrio halioticoli]GAD91388.1 putative TRAP transporter small permease protein [Vibrio halioticoli NBRC 102217]
MKNKLNSFREYLDKAILTICGLLIITLVVTVTWQVFSRYILNDPSSFTDELSRYLMIWLGLLGASYLFGQKGHLAITLLLDKLSGWTQIGLNIFINLVSLSFIFLAFLKGGIGLVGKTSMQISPALDIPMSYVYLILPLSAVISGIYICINVADSIIEHKQGR